MVRYTFRHQSGNPRTWDNVEDISIDSSGVISRDTIVDDVNSHICGWWQDSLLQLYGEPTIFVGASWVDLDSATGRTGELGPAGSHPTAGGQAPPFAPPQVCRLIKKQVTAARGNRSGRLYINNIGEPNVDDGGHLASAHQSASTALAEQFRSTIRSYSYPGDVGAHPAAWRVVHVNKPNKLDATTWTWTSTDVQSVSCDALVATQRRRIRA